MCQDVGVASPSKVCFFFFFFICLGGGGDRLSDVFFTPVPEEEILDYLAHNLITQVLTGSADRFLPPSEKIPHL